MGQPAVTPPATHLLRSRAAEAVAIDWVEVGDPGNACEVQPPNAEAPGGCFGSMWYYLAASSRNPRNSFRSLQGNPTGVRVATFPDSDDDGILDPFDKCLLIADGPDTGICYSSDVQMDTDGDGYGNPCDGDFNNDGVVNSCDVLRFIADLHWALDSGIGTDMDSDGLVNSSDVVLFGPQLGAGVPGP
jgi:hypothetical protein